MPRATASILIAQGAFSSGLTVGQRRYDEKGAHTKREPERIVDTAQLLRAAGADVVLINGVERLANDATGRAGIDQFQEFAFAFSAEFVVFMPTVYLGLEKRDRVAASAQDESHLWDQRAAFGNAMFFKEKAFIFGGGGHTFLPVLGPYNRLDAHEPRNLILREAHHIESGAQIRFAITELADRNPGKDPFGVRDVENAIQLMAVVEALRNGLDNEGAAKPTFSIVAGSLNRDSKSVLPTRARAMAILATHCPDLMRFGEIADPYIEAAVQALPQDEVTLGEFLEARQIIAVDSGPTGHQQERAPEQLDYMLSHTPAGSAFRPTARSVIQEQMPVGFRVFTLTDFAIEPVALV